MSDIYDLAILGGGPAGITAAIYASRARLNTIWIDKNFAPGGQITATYEVDNYPGMPGISGMDLGEAFGEHARKLGLEPQREKILSLENISGDIKTIRTKKHEYQAKTLILAMGVMTAKLLKGEDELLGRGVSYCATCDGMFYKDKEIAVLCNDPKYEHEVEYLADLAAKVTYFPMFSDSQIKKENVTISKDFPLEIKGSDRVTGLVLKSGKVLELDGIFCLRNAIAPSKLVSGLEIENGHIKVDRTQKTNLPGCFAAGDCTGRPYQYTKAVGEGNVAAHSCISYLTE
mgnify:CR=1 FL=1